MLINVKVWNYYRINISILSNRKIFFDWKVRQVKETFYNGKYKAILMYYQV